MKEYKLINPIVLGEEIIDTLKFDEPSTENMRKYNVDLSKDGLELAEGQYRVVCACVNNATEAHINLLKARDLIGCFGQCIDFFCISPSVAD